MKTLFVIFAAMLVAACEPGGRAQAPASQSAPVSAQPDSAQQLFQHFNQYTQDDS